LLDASALLALLFREPGHETVAEACPAAISAANLSEVVAKLMDRGVPALDATSVQFDADLQVIPVSETIALDAGTLRSVTRPFGLSLGDRLCLATAQAHGLSVLTADSAWQSLSEELGIAITNIRPQVR
jgi:PIN domain nuclease of toxin-antitoxin system